LKKLAALSFFLLMLYSCGSIKPAAPELPLSQLNQTPLPESKINIPLSINFEDILNDYSSKIPSQLTGEGKVGPAKYTWQANRQPFKLAFLGDTMHVTDDALFNISGFIKNPFNGQWKNIASCNACLHIGISTHFGVSNDFTLFKNTHLTQFDLNACNLNIAGLNITPGIKPQARETFGKLLDTLGRRIDNYNFKPLIQPVWVSLNKPIKMGDIGYITLNPSAVRVGQLATSGNTLNMIAGITAKPVFSLADPGKSTSTILPDLTSDNGGNGFNLHLDIHLDYQQLNQKLNAAIGNKEIQVGAKGHLLIKSADIYGTGNDHLLIKVNFSGHQDGIPYHGLLYFTCLPVYQPETGDLYVSNIDFDTNTITRLKEGPTAWLLDAGIKKYLHDQLHFNISGQINNLKSKLNQALTQPIVQKITLNGNVDTLSADGILPLNNYILLRVSASGNLSVRYN
jgi:hypothetical protein